VVETTTSGHDAYDLARFVRAQEHTYAQALAEIRGGRKRTHWMWYVFPQLSGLGSSPMAQRYAIAGRAEARAYLAHPLLGPRLHEIAAAVIELGPRPASSVFGSPDDLKLRSSATLFASVSGPGSVFERLLECCFAGAPDEKTVALLRQEQDT
jgi:uncharacterized protein (DUF1810 family)